MAITNLANTIWVFRSTFVFSQSGTYSITFTSGGHSYTSIKFANYSSGKYVDYDNTRVFGSTPNTWISQGYRIIKITGGTDVTNATLIAWFNTVAKQISVEDLSNTSWVFNGTGVWAEDLSSKSINFTSNGNNYTEISVSTLHSGDDVYIYYGNTNVYEFFPDEGINSWLDNQYRLISITDGIDTNNPDLMLLLATYATQVQVADLSGTSWIFDNSPNIYDTLVLEIPFHVNLISNNESYDGIICGGGNEYSEGLIYGLDMSSDIVAYHHEPYSYWTNEAYKTISISNGTDVINPDLISWLSQNATLQPITPTKTFDLSTLQLSAGTHTIQVKARATGYRDSNFSNSVSYEVASGYTVSISVSADSYGDVYLATLYYSVNNGNTWIEVPFTMSETKTYSVLGTQIKFKIVVDGTCNGSFTISLNGTTVLTAPGRSGTYISDNYVLSADATVYCHNSFSCFVENTKIKLADGTDKFVQDITYDDELLVWDFYEGKFAKAKPCWIMKTQTATYYKQIVLDDGSTINLVGQGEKCHRLFNVTKQQFIYANECVGNDVYTLDGIKKVVACVIVEKEVKFYNLTTEKYLDCFAEGVLTGSRLNNMYHISNMKYDSNIRLISEKEEAERWKIREALRK